MEKDKSQVIPFWVSVIAILGVFLMIVGGLVSKFDPSLLTNGHVVSQVARIYTDYMFSRSTALALFIVFLLATKSQRLLAAAMGLLALIQAIDVFDDALRGDFMLVPGTLVLACLFALAAWRLFGGSLRQRTK